MIFLVLINASIFIFLSFLHFYWALGGKKGMSAVLPSPEEGKSVFTPGPFVTLTIAAAMGVFAFIIIGNLDIFREYINLSIFKYATLVIAVIFTLRAIGDFKYMGFFKKATGTVFARNDTRYYSPLCVIIAIVSLLIFLLD